MRRAPRARRTSRRSTRADVDGRRDLVVGRAHLELFFVGVRVLGLAHDALGGVGFGAFSVLLFPTRAPGQRTLSRGSR